MRPGSILLIALAGLVTLSNAQLGKLFKVTSHLDGNAITSTEYLEDPGPYDVYATKTEPYGSLDTQIWEYFEYSGKCQKCENFCFLRIVQTRTNF